MLAFVILLFFVLKSCESHDIPHIKYSGGEFKEKYISNEKKDLEIEIYNEISSGSIRDASEYEADIKNRDELNEIYTLQIGIFHKESDAEKKWDALCDEKILHCDALIKYIEKKKVYQSDVLYLLKVGDFKYHDEARSACDDLMKKQHGCLVVIKEVDL